jgi:hypothetical protein
MIKYILLAVNFLGIVFISFFNDQEISVSMQVPEEVQGGREFQVTLTIDKGDLESFSRFIQELPNGLTAKRVSTANADFTFEDQRVRLIWLKLPAEPKITVTYDVTVDKHLKGSFTLGGEFSFIEQNERKSLDVSAGHEIKILPDPTVPGNQLVDIKDFGKEALPGHGTAGENLAVLRREPVQSGPNEFTVELLVKKDNLNKFAKIEEYLPEGFRAVEGDSKDGIFSFNQGIVKILWMNLPNEQTFTVSYKIIPDPGKSLADLNISGSFSYITGNQSKTIAVTEKNFDLAEAGQQKDTSGNQQTATVENEEPLISVRKEETKSSDTASETTKSGAIQISTSSLLEPSDGVYYRIQLAAGHNQIDIDRYFRKRHVTDPVKMEYHEGWRKYTSGSFKIYHDARDYRVKIWNTTPINDAFVAAYSDGNRITVQEALMISGQKWYR